MHVAFPVDSLRDARAVTISGDGITLGDVVKVAREGSFVKVDAGYQHAAAIARERGLRIPMLEGRA